jgi:predicted Zn finger-like uncharacterized protein
MLLDCKNCNNKFTLEEDEFKIEGQLIKCPSCKEEWTYESKSNYLEKRLAELDQDLYKTELQLNTLNNKHSEKIDQLEKNLKIKKDQQSKQKLLEDKIALYEKRITETEKTNSEQADLEIKIIKMENEVEKVSETIFSKNKDIEKKANYLEMKINSYKDDQIKEQQKKIIDYDDESDVINLKNFENEEKKNKEETTEEPKKKTNYFWPKS